MLRRDIFNLIFNKNLVTEPLVNLPDPVVCAPDYISDRQETGYSREWQAPFLPLTFLPELSTSYSFTITLQSKHTPAFLQMGKIKLGINDGYLFIADLTDHRLITTTKSQAGVKLVLAVKPQPNGVSYAKLIAMDDCGLTLATLKSTQHLTADWSGPISLHTTLTALRVEGMPSLKIEPNPKTTV